MCFECLSCPKLGVSCNGANFIALSASDLLQWCRQRKEDLRWSNAKLADASNVPKGTIDRLFSGEGIDFKHETIRPLVKALIGGEWDNPCPHSQPSAEPDPALSLQVHDLQKDLEYANKTINRLELSVRSWKQAIYAMMILCGVMAVSLVAYLCMDMGNTNIGLFREDYISPAAIFPILGTLAFCMSIALIIKHKFKNKN